MYNISALKVEDFATWKSGFDIEEGKAIRKAAGMKAYQILQAADNPNYVVIITEWDSIDAARKFFQSEELKNANRESGVIEMFGTYDTSKFLIEVEKKSV